MSDMTDQSPLPSGTLVREYSIGRVLGVGGFGITYEAVHTHLGKRVAIKEYFPDGFARRLADGTVTAQTTGSKPEVFRRGLDRFLSEARTLEDLPAHPNLVRVRDVFVERGSGFMVMEFVEGETLEAAILRSGPQEAGAVRFLIEKLCDGLKAVHAAGFQHRDIKPANIMLRAADGEPMLIDFGAARRLETAGHTTTRFVSHGYSALELSATQLKAGPASDIYGLAASAWFALKGRTPPDPMTERFGANPDPLASLAPMGGPWVQFLAALDKGLALQPDARPQSVTDWRDSFGARPTVVAEGERPVPSPAVPAAAADRRQKAFVAASWCVALLGGILAWQLVFEQSQVATRIDLLDGITSLTYGLLAGGTATWLTMWIPPPWQNMFSKNIAFSLIISIITRSAVGFLFYVGFVYGAVYISLSFQFYSLFGSLSSLLTGGFVAIPFGFVAVALNSWKPSRFRWISLSLPRAGLLALGCAVVGALTGAAYASTRIDETAGWRLLASQGYFVTPGRSVPPDAAAVGWIELEPGSELAIAAEAYDRSSLRAFQAAQSLEQTGEIDRATWNRLRELDPVNTWVLDPDQGHGRQEIEFVQHACRVDCTILLREGTYDWTRRGNVELAEARRQERLAAAAVDAAAGAAIDAAAAVPAEGAAPADNQLPPPGPLYVSAASSNSTLTIKPHPENSEPVVFQGATLSLAGGVTLEGIQITRGAVEVTFGPVRISGVRVEAPSDTHALSVLTSESEVVRGGEVTVIDSEFTSTSDAAAILVTYTLLMDEPTRPTSDQTSVRFENVRMTGPLEVSGHATLDLQGGEISVPELRFSPIWVRENARLTATGVRNACVAAEDRATARVEGSDLSRCAGNRFFPFEARGNSRITVGPGNRIPDWPGPDRIAEEDNGRVIIE